MLLNDNVQLNKAEKAWKPSVRKVTRPVETGKKESVETQEVFRQFRSILNKLTPQMFERLRKKVTELPIDTEERLKGVMDLIFEKSISEPNFSATYASMCHCLMGLRVPSTDKSGVSVNFRRLLLTRCQKEFDKDMHDAQIFEEKQKQLDAASGEEEKQRLKAELEEAKNQARRRSLGNIRLVGELFKLKMLTGSTMQDCIVSLLRSHDEESLEYLCRLLSTIGKDLDFETAKCRMDQYFTQLEKIIKERKTSSRIRFMLQDMLDLRSNNWVPRRVVQGPRTIDQIHKEAEQEEQMKVEQDFLSRREWREESSGGSVGRMGRRGCGVSGGSQTSGRESVPQDQGWNTVPISTNNEPIDTFRLSKISVPDFNNQLLAPMGKGTWVTGCKGLNSFSALHQLPSSSASLMDSLDSLGSQDREEREEWVRLPERNDPRLRPRPIPHFNIQLLAPLGKGTWAHGRPATSTLNRFSALDQQLPSSTAFYIESVDFQESQDFQDVQDFQDFQDSQDSQDGEDREEWVTAPQRNTSWRQRDHGSDPY
ncbi:eukaryotic translation initiation factor 4 gamma 1-like [Diretmus argenteus]